MFGLGTKQHKPRTSLVLSVGSSSVRASFVADTGSHERPVILTHHNVTFQDTVSNFSQYVQYMSKACVEVIQKNIDDGTFHNPDRIVCVLEKPWYISQTNTFSEDNIHEFTFEKKNIQNIINTHGSKLQSFIQTTPFAKVQTKQIEKRVVHSAVNGYEVDSLPSNIRLKKIDITTYLSVAPTMVLDAVERSVHRYFKGQVLFATSSLAFFAVSRNMFDDVDTFLCMSVSKNTTEIAFVEQGALLSMFHFMQGTQEIFNHNNSAVHNQTLLSHARLLNREKIQTHSSDIYQKLLEQSASRWRQSFSDGLAKLAKTGMVSDTIVLVVEKDLRAWVQHAIADARNNHLSRSGSPFRVILVTMDTLDDYIGSKVAYPDPVNTLHSIFLTLFY